MFQMKLYRIALFALREFEMCDSRLYTFILGLQDKLRETQLEKELKC